ncbi:MAG: DUF547 domain-containing protein [Saprospiraceae bacterium]|nr:DUF547 domain-containing protein [Saprospiraceae bacterium]
MLQKKMQYLIIILCIGSGCKSSLSEHKSTTIMVTDTFIQHTETVKKDTIKNTVTKEYLMHAKTKAAPKIFKKNPDPIKKDIDKHGESDIKKSTKSPAEVLPDIKTSSNIVKEETISKNPPLFNPKSPDHSIFNAILQKYVSISGKVNYKGLKLVSSMIDKYLFELASIENIEYLSYEDQLSFWINVYNAATLQLIVKHYPVKSIKDINKGQPWDIKFIMIENKIISLNDLENNILRKKYKDARVHFVLNCAAKSCPPLTNIAFTKDNLYTMMEDKTREFINSSENIILKDRIQISPIFEWYKSDFDNVFMFISTYSSIKPEKGTLIGYGNYNWSLNE